jgi:hypothetical protein
MTVPNLSVRSVLGGWTTPIGVAFLSGSEWFVIEKNTGKVPFVDEHVIQGTALDLAVNNFSERGLLGIALHPDFASNHFVYLFWTWIAPPPPASDPFFPTQAECADTPTLGVDSEVDLAVPLLGNRVDRFVWNSATPTLTFDRNLIKLRSFQNDAASKPPNQGDSEQPMNSGKDTTESATHIVGRDFGVVTESRRRPTATCWWYLWIPATSTKFFELGT